MYVHQYEYGTNVYDEYKLQWTPKIRQYVTVYFQLKGDTEWAEKSTAGS